MVALGTDFWSDELGDVADGFHRMDGKNEGGRRVKGLYSGDLEKLYNGKLVPFESQSGVWLRATACDTARVSGEIITVASLAVLQAIPIPR